MSDAIQRIREALAWSARAFGDHSDDIRALLDRLDAAEREIERLRHDIERHIAIASEHATECERLRDLCDDLYSDLLAAGSLAPRGCGAYALIQETIKLRRDRWARKQAP